MNTLSKEQQELESSLEEEMAPSAREINWQDFRDHLATADRQGRRQWVYPKRVKGEFYRWRTYVSWLLLAVMFAGPFVRINGNPLLMVNIVERRFSIAGQIFWPQDTVIFAVAMLLFLVSIIVFTMAFGRLWCGWTCPQTLLMEMVFRKIEYWIEGDAADQRKLRLAPWRGRKVWKKLIKHSLFFGLSFVIGNTLLSYIVGVDQLKAIITDDPRNHITGLIFMMLFTLVFYAIFARFREQACTFICPYGRLQSTLLDDNSMVVAYDDKRGEQRGPLRRSQPREQRRTAGVGDCVDCRECVSVCPTGIDIRNGTQMECIHCTSCIDACNRVMEKIGLPRGLIRYGSANSIESGEPLKFTARMGLYTGVLIALAAVLAILVVTRSDVETMLLRAPGALFQPTASGNIENLYTLKIVNKTTRDIPIQLKIENKKGNITVLGGRELVAPKAGLVQTSVLVELAPTVLDGPNSRLKIGVYSDERQLETVDTVFSGPRNLPVTH